MSNNFVEIRQVITKEYSGWKECKCCKWVFRKDLVVELKDNNVVCNDCFDRHY